MTADQIREIVRRNPNITPDQIACLAEEIDGTRASVNKIERRMMEEQARHDSVMADLGNQLAAIRAVCKHRLSVFRRPTAECTPTATCEACGQIS